MLGKVFGILCLIALVFGLATGAGEAMGNAVIDGASAAVGLTVSLLGMMALWSGLLQVLADAGFLDLIARFLSPFLRLFFPDATRKKNGLREIAANVSANLLGLGNAATPFALEAMKKLGENSASFRRDGRASREMITLAVLNTASFSILPTTILALRRSAGSAAPYAVLPPIFVVSLSSAGLALILCSLLGRRDDDLS